MLRGWRLLVRNKLFVLQRLVVRRPSCVVGRLAAVRLLCARPRALLCAVSRPRRIAARARLKQRLS